jgi:8-oxo-dGTP pyrophosphatase MutT (NUDIX family)
MSEIPELIEAATVVLLRDTGEGIETVLLRRNSRLGFGGGAWVFPGGRVDEEDRDPSHPDDEEAAARRAAAREALEEAGLVVEPPALVPFSHWTPPDAQVKRFSTWFFVGRAPETTVVIDDGEIVDHVWASPEEALAMHAAGEVELLPPTWVTLHFLQEHADVASVLEAAASREIERFTTRFVHVDGEVLSLWHGDAGYVSGDPAAEGGRHRLHMSGLPWRYERT